MIFRCISIAGFLKYYLSVGVISLSVISVSVSELVDNMLRCDAIASASFALLFVQFFSDELLGK